jgi:hypothetical protein
VLELDFFFACLCVGRFLWGEDRSNFVNMPERLSEIDKKHLKGGVGGVTWCHQAKHARVKRDHIAMCCVGDDRRTKEEEEDGGGGRWREGLSR